MLYIVSLRDKKCIDLDSGHGGFFPTQCVPNVNAWLRVLGDEINSARDSKEIWATHPEDFQVVVFGTFNEGDGSMELYSRPVVFTELLALVKSVN